MAEPGPCSLTDPPRGAAAETRELPTQELWVQSPQHSPESESAAVTGFPTHRALAALEPSALPHGRGREPPRHRRAEGRRGGRGTERGGGPALLPCVPCGRAVLRACGDILGELGSIFAGF